PSAPVVRALGADPARFRARPGAVHGLSHLQGGPRGLAWADGRGGGAVGRRAHVPGRRPRLPRGHARRPGVPGARRVERGGARVGVLAADLNGPTMAKMLGVRGRTLVVGAGGVEPPVSALGIRVMSMDLLLADDATPLTWDAPSQAEAHTWRGTMEANALREF